MHAMTTPIELTRLINDDGVLTQRLHLTPEGKLAKDSSQCRMSIDRMERVRLEDWRRFGPLIEATPPNVAYALGALRDPLPDAVGLVRKDGAQAAQAGVVARTHLNFVYRPGGPRLRPGRLRHQGHARRRQDPH